MPSNRDDPTRIAQRHTGQSGANVTKTRVAFRLRPDLDEALRELARRDRRSLTGQLEHLIERAAREAGILTG